MTSTIGVKKIQYPNGTDILTLDSSGTLAIGGAGAFNAGLMASQIVALQDSHVAQQIDLFRTQQTQNILDNPDPRQT